MNILRLCTPPPILVPHDRNGDEWITIGQPHKQAVATVWGAPRASLEMEANAALLAAAWDHALIWWATEYSDNFDIIKEKGGEVFYDLASKGVSMDPAGHFAGPSLAIDSFGYPNLTDDLRARLIAEMEAAS